MATVAAHVSPSRQAWNFARHYLEMCIAMCVGGVPLTLVTLAGLSSLTGASVRDQYPQLSLLVMAFTITLPMAAWMLFRGMPRRPTLEMAGAAFLVAIVLIMASWIGGIEEAPQLKVGEFCGLTCAAMFAVMLFRLDLYTGRTGHHMAHAS
jgi:hypothetical protein